MSNISKHDIHWLDKYLKIIFGNGIVIIVFSCFVFLIGIIISIYSNNWIWFNRFGSLITIAGVLLTMSPIFIRGVYLSQSECGGWAWTDKDGKLLTTTSEDRKIGNNIITGIFISIIGTLIWGFGDLIGLVVAKFCQ